MARRRVKDLMRRASELGIPARLVLAYIVDEIERRGGQARISLAEVSRDAGISHMTAIKAVTALVGAGLLERVKPATSNNPSVFRMGTV